MPSDEPSNKQSVNTGLRLNPITPALTLVGCGRAWKRLRITKGNPDASLPVKLNALYARFEASNTEAYTRAPAVLDDCVITLSVANVNKTFKQVNIHKAAGPDGLPGCVLKASADQLSSVFTDIFNLSLTESVIPTCFKQTTIVPVPKEAKVTCLNNYHPVALTSVAMNCFERLVMAHINSILLDTLDPLQFAYRPNRSTDDASSIALHTAHSRLDRINTYLRILFIDYSSAFNTIVPMKLINKLRTLGLNISLCNWILDFLTGRHQVVRVGNNTSAELILNTGAPQGCVLSPLLYSLFTHDCVAKKRAQQNLFPLRRLKRFGMGLQILKRFYSCTIESILTGCITAWYGNCSASDRKALQRVVRTAQYITGAKLPAIQDLYNRWCQREAHKIVRDSSNPSYRLFSLLPHGKRYQSAKSRTKRLLNRFYPQAIRLLNN
uniref:Reverse transcriptase domain-containing protein n=1 Tax=Salmo trutta TaxID=8032 RepID=A0A674ASX1_SALTR